MKHSKHLILSIFTMICTNMISQNTFFNEIQHSPNSFYKVEQKICGISENSCGRIYTINYGYGNLISHHGMWARDNYPQIAIHDSKGNIVTQRTNQGNGTFDFFSKVIVGSDGNVYTCTRNKLHWNGNGQDAGDMLSGSFQIKKLNPDNLNQIWSREYTVIGKLNGSDFYREGMAYDLIESFSANNISDGFVACGMTTFYDPGNTGNNYTELQGPIDPGEDNEDGIADGLYMNPSIVKFDANGNLIWGYRINIVGMSPPVNFKVAEKIVQTNDGGYLIAGIADPDLNISNNNIVFVKLSNTGNIQWVKTSNIDLNVSHILEMKVVGNQLIVLANNNYLIRCTVSSSGLAVNFSKKIANTVNFEVRLNDFEIDGNDFIFIGKYIDKNSSLTYPFVLKTNNSFAYTFGINSSNFITADINLITIYRSKIDNFLYIGGERVGVWDGYNFTSNLILMKIDNQLKLTQPVNSTCDIQNAFPTGAWNLVQYDQTIENIDIPTIQVFSEHEIGVLSTITPQESLPIICKSCQNNFPVTITANISPPLCDNFNVTFTANPGYYYYIWKRFPYPSGEPEFIKTCDNYHTTKLAGQYSVVGYFDEYCTSGNSNSLNIFPQPVASFTLSDAQKCENEVPVTATSTATVSMGGITGWDWEYIPTNSSQVWRGTNSYINVEGVAAVPGLANVINLKVMSNSGCWSETHTDFLDIYEAPIANFTVTTVCDYDPLGTLTTFDKSSTTGPQNTYEWDFENDGIFDLTTTTTTNSPITNDYDYGTFIAKLKVTETISGLGCHDEITKPVTVWKNPIPSFAASNSCQSRVKSFNGSAISNFSIVSWQWDFGDGQTGTGQNPGNLYNGFGQFTVTLTVTDVNGCIGSFTDQVFVVQAPDVPIISASPSTHNICTNSVLALSATNIAPGNSILWSAINDPNINNAATTNVNYYSPSITSSETIGLKVTDPNTTCYTFATPYGIWTHDLDIMISSNSSNNNLCTGASISLSGLVSSSQQNYEWRWSTDNWNTYSIVGYSQVYNATQPGEYRYLASNNYGCTKLSNVININQAGALTISDNLFPTNYLAPSPSPALLSITTINQPQYSQIQWFRNDVPITSGTPSSPLTLPGDYYVTAIGCGLEKSNINVVKFDNNSGAWDQTFMSGYTCSSCTANISSPPGTGFIMDGDIVLSGTSNLTIEAKINFKGCHRIIVNPGCSLTITSNSVISAENQWEGIHVIGSGGVTINNGADISNAIIGVLSEDGGKINVQNSKFGRNIVHIAFDDYTRLLPSFIGANTFGHVIDANTSLNCTGYSEYSNLSIPRGTQIFIAGTSSSKSITFINNTAWLTQKYNGNNNVWLAANNNNDISIEFNTIKGFYNSAMKLTNCNNVSIDGNSMTALNEFDYVYNCPCIPRGTGIYFKNCDQATVSGNILKRWQYGVEYYENLSSSLNSTVSGNKFIDCKYGLVIAPLENPTVSVSPWVNKNYWGTTDYIRLIITCNLFDGNEVGILGSGNLVNQGAPSPVIAPGNRFKNGSLLNSIHSMIWNWGNTNTFNYYISAVNGEDNPLSVSPSTNITIDGDPINLSTSAYLTPTSSVNNCTSSLMRSIKNSETSINSAQIKISPVLYPNPVTNVLNIENLSGNSVIFVYDSNGKKVDELNCLDEKTSLSLANFSEGIYLIMIKDSMGTSNYKILKVAN